MQPRQIGEKVKIILICFGVFIAYILIGTCVETAVRLICEYDDEDKSIVWLWPLFIVLTIVTMPVVLLGELSDIVVRNVRERNKR